MSRYLVAVLFLVLGAPVLAQTQPQPQPEPRSEQPAQAPKVRYSQEEIIGRIAECMQETAPKDWRTIVFTLDQESPDPDNPGKTVASHKAAGKADKALKDIKPCRRPDWVSKAVQTFREGQDEKARGWTGITLSMQRDGHFTINFRYPK